MAVSAPPAERPPSLGRMVNDVREELRTRPKLPPGDMRPSLRRSHAFQRDPKSSLLDIYERYGPVASVRMYHLPIVTLLGPEANHFVTVGGAEHFSWRQGSFGEHLDPLLGAGLITSDGEYHDRNRRIMMPAFHARRMDAALEAMQDETQRALSAWRPGATVDVYHWIRDLSMSIAMRALLGLDPRAHGHEAAVLFERALHFYETEGVMMMLRGPRTPWARMQEAKEKLDALVYAEIARRRERGGDGEDLFSMLLAAEDEDGTGFSDKELRDQLMTMLFAGHDTSSSTVAFLLYELARHPDVAERARSDPQQLDMAVDETLRKYPPVWFGPRRTVSAFEFAGHRIPAGTHIIHSSWATHHMPHVFPEPDRFVPERFTPEARRALPKGAYIPFGGGSRICIGKRFGQLVVKSVAAAVLQRFELTPQPDYDLQIALAPTLSPRGGLPLVVGARL